MSSIQDLITRQAQTAGVPPALALAVAQKESGFNQGAIGAAGEIGVFQLMPATAAGLQVDPANLDQNVSGGVSLLASLYTQFGNWTQALEAYNAGPTAVTSGSVPASSEAYAAAVLAASGVPDTADSGGSSADSGSLANTGSMSDFLNSPVSLDLDALSGSSGMLWAVLAVAGLVVLGLAGRK